MTKPIVSFHIVHLFIHHCFAIKYSRTFHVSKIARRLAFPLCSPFSITTCPSER